MAMAVLRPHDCTTHNPFVSADAVYASRFVTRSKSTSGRKANSVPNSRRRPSEEKRGGRDQTEKVRKEAKELEMGKVRILKRGDKLRADLSDAKSRIDRGRSVTFEKVEDVVLCSTDRLGPDPEVMNEEISVSEKKKTAVVVVEDKFAGCVVVASPPPSSLPMPKNYWMRREKYDPVSMAVDLRRMLRLDLI